MLNRRSFAASAAAALLTSGLHPHFIAAQAHPSAAAQRFSVMMWTLNKVGAFEANLDLVARAGFHHVQLVDEFKHWSEGDYTRITAQMQALQISVDAMAGMKLGFADPSGADPFLAELKSIIPIAQRLRCPQIILLSGKVLPGAAPGQQHEAAIATLKRSSTLLQQAGIVGVIEPIDKLENPTIYLDGVTEAFQLARAVGSPSIKVLYDLYHEQRGLGNLIEKLDRNIDQVGLIHVADVPGRHEPGTGEVNFCGIYRKLAQLGYTGDIAMEFYPSADPLETLKRAREEAERCMASAT